MADGGLKSWKIAGFVATLVIVLAFPLYEELEKHSKQVPAEVKQPSSFVGSQKCAECHKPQYDKWRGSHHERAMAVADGQTVLGDFDDAEFEYFDVVSRFYRKEGKFFVHTQGPDGRMGDFEITHTFGWFPLQQYLVPFDRGRLQCLPIAWDVRDRRWFHLYSEREIAPADWLYWTNNGQNWNGMCAECHSTNLQKGYDPDTDRYHTTWSEISVGCEACHGPGSAHVRWAELPEMGRPEVVDAALEVRTGGLSARRQIELCAPCHSRRMSLGDNIHQHADFLDYGIPQLLTPGYYYPDGQILDEVYVYGSFIQSKMYAREVRCSDCHDVHSILRVKEGNDLCLQCHRTAIYDSAAHHFHKKAGEAGDAIRSADGEILFDVGSGAKCEACHMPRRTYMGIDDRPDHGFRIPQPDLTISTGSPNACNRCHQDKSVRWSSEAILKWYGQRKRPHYGTILAAGRRGTEEVMPDLLRLVEDRRYPTIVRATALALLAAYPDQERLAVFKRAFDDEEALIRYTAVRNFPAVAPQVRIRRLGPMLYDPVKAVRIEAAARLADLSKTELPIEMRARYRSALDEYLQATRRLGDFASARHNLGNLYAHLGETKSAIANYRKAIEIDDLFYPAKVNLATQYNLAGDNAAAERLLREVAASEPELYEVHYSLGLLLAEMKRYDEAVYHLREAARGLQDQSRIHYNLGLLLQHVRKDDEAEIALKTALALSPDHPDYLYALTVFYLQRKRFDEAEQIARELAGHAAERERGQELLDAIERSKHNAVNEP